MKKLCCVIASVVVSILPATSHGALIGASAGFGRTPEASSCLEVDGYVLNAGSSPSSGRWLGAYWASAPTVLPGGACSEDDPHVDLTINCVVTVAEGSTQTLFAATRGADAKNYLVKVVDRGSEGDEFGVAEGKPDADEPLCGAGELTTTPISFGQFNVVAAG